MQCVIDACKEGRLAALPAVVISNNADSGALQRADDEQIPHYYLSAKHHPDTDSLDAAVRDALLEHAVEIVLLAGYMKKLGRQTLTAFAGRVLNIHPALLPKFGGRGMYGMHVHEAVIKAGETESGATVHIVDGEYDRGQILAQRAVPVELSDTPELLAERVLALEHQLYVDTLNRIVSGEISLA
jgi:phosphoribosylglycinamide formyltransferase-1